MDLPVSTYALLFPAVSLLFLAYTNRFLHLSSLIRTLYTDWMGQHEASLVLQIANLRRRLRLIRWMQLLGALSLLCSVIGMLIRITASSACAVTYAAYALITALIMMIGSLVLLTIEIAISDGALRVQLRAIEGPREPQGSRDS